MANTSTNLFWKVTGLGAIAGMRTFLAPAVAVHLLSQQNSGYLAKSPLSFMQSEKVGLALKILAAGELVGDKLPFTPARTAAAGLVARCISGSLVGASLFKAAGRNALGGAFIGGITATGITYLTYLARKNAAKTLNIPDPFIGAVEDVVAIGLGIGISKSF